MRSISLLGCAGFLILSVVSPAVAQEPVAKQDAPASTGTIFQRQPSPDGDGRSVIVAPDGSRAAPTPDPVLNSPASRTEQAEPEGRSKR